MQPDLQVRKGGVVMQKTLSILILLILMVVLVPTTVLSQCPGDSDCDGIPDDGDGSGVAGDNPCATWQTTGCDDNCPDRYNPAQEDGNGNGIGDYCDPCCDLPGDANNDGVVNMLDVTKYLVCLYFEPCTFPCYNQADTDGSCHINILDITRLIAYLYKGGPPLSCGCVVGAL